MRTGECAGVECVYRGNLETTQDCSGGDHTSFYTYLSAFSSLRSVYFEATLIECVVDTAHPFRTNLHLFCIFQDTDGAGRARYQFIMLFL